jgi:hypothetical protein
MKKHIYTLAIIAVISLGLTACSEPKEAGETSYNEFSVQTESKTPVTESERGGTDGDVEVTAVADDGSAVVTDVGAGAGVAGDNSDDTAVFEDDSDDIFDSDADWKIEPFFEDSQTEPYFEGYSETAVPRMTEVFIDHTEPVPGESGVVDIPQGTEVFIAHTEPEPGESGVGDIPQ